MAEDFPREIPDQIAFLSYKIAELERRARNRRRPGSIAEIDHDKGLYKVKLSEQDGKPYLTGWINPRQAGAAGVKIDVLLYEGENVDVISESGDLTDAQIDLSTYSEKNGRENDGTPLHIKVDGDAKLIAGKFIIQAAVDITGDVKISGAFNVEGSSFTHNGKNVGSDHGHETAPPGPPGPPI